MNSIRMFKQIEDYWYNRYWKRKLRKHKRALRQMETTIADLEHRTNRLFPKK